MNILRLLYFFVSLQLNAELHLENYLESGHNDFINSTFPISPNHEGITLVAAIHSIFKEPGSFIFNM